jgi:hypothetical protein
VISDKAPGRRPDADEWRTDTPRNSKLIIYFSRPALWAAFSIAS